MFEHPFPLSTVVFCRVSTILLVPLDRYPEVFFEDPFCPSFLGDGFLRFFDSIRLGSLSSAVYESAVSSGNFFQCDSAIPTFNLTSHGMQHVHALSASIILLLDVPFLFSRIEEELRQARAFADLVGPLFDLYSHHLHDFRQIPRAEEGPVLEWNLTDTEQSHLHLFFSKRTIGGLFLLPYVPLGLFLPSHPKYVSTSLRPPK